MVTGSLCGHCSQEDVGIFYFLCPVAIVVTVFKQIWG